MKNATNIENTIIVAFLLLEYNIKVDERERMWSKVLIKNLKIDIIIVIKKKEVILLITENNNLEFKRELTDSIVKEIIAFCNTTGGTIILGYNDNGKVVGLKNAKEDLDRLSSKINDSIEPSVNFLVSSRIEREDNKEIIVVEVLKGSNKPYYIKSKGMTIDGVFVRLGATVQRATRETIKEMIVESSGISFEKNISINQDLTFTYANKIFKKKNIAFGDIEKKNLGLINADNKYTNLALLISDQCPYSIKVARYKDNTKTEFLDSKEFSEQSILSQYENAYEYLMMNNRMSSKIDGMERIDEYEYPKNSLRELLCNTITHRDYEINGSNLIHIFNDKIEFLSLGGLVSGLTIEDIKLGSSSSRNPNLVNIFHRLNFVEAYGTGIPRMYEEYKASITSPEIKVAPNSFLVILPKLNLKNEYTLIIEYLKQNNQGTRENFETILKLGKSATINILNEMLEKEIIEKIGFSKNIVYKLK